MAKQKPETQKSVTRRQPSFLLNSEKGFALLIFCFSFLLYFNTVFNNYNLDDELVTQNHRLTSKGISAIPEIFSSPYYQDNAGYKYEYRPIVLVTFAIEHSLFGEHAWLSHLINVLLYSLLCLLLFNVLKRMLTGYSIIWSLLITLFFAAHPAHTEVVASIKNRDEILSLIFSLLALDFSCRLVQQKNSLHIIAVVGFFVLALLSKSTAAVFAFLIPLALVLLTPLSFGYLILLSLALIIPAVLFARLYSVSQQLIFGMALAGAIIALYGLKNIRQILPAIKTWALTTYSAFAANRETVSNETYSLNFSFLKNLSSGIPFLGLIVFSLGCSLTGIYNGVLWMSVLPLVLLAAVYLSLGNTAKLILISIISLIALAALLKFYQASSPLEAALCIFLGAAILSPNKFISRAGIVNYILYAALTIAIKHAFFPLVGLAFIAMLHKRTYVLSYILVATFLAFYIKILYTVLSGAASLQLSLISLPLVSAAAALAWQHKLKWLSFSVILIPVFLTAVFLSNPPSSTFSLSQKAAKGYYTLSAVRAVDPVPVNSARPLVFMETPVSSSDPLSVRVGTAMNILGKYIKLIFIPYPLSYYYGYAVIVPANITDAGPALWLTLHLILLGLALFLINRATLLSFAILFYLASIAAFSSLAMPIPGMMADRFLLVPSVGFCIALVYILATLVAKLNLKAPSAFADLNKPFKISATLIMLLYSLLTFSRNLDWKDRVTLFSHDISSVENSAQAHNLLGLHLFFASNAEPDVAKMNELREKALLHFNRAVEIYPQFLNAAYDRGRLLESMGRYSQALESYLVATKIDSNFKMPYFSMGVIYQNQKNNAEAAACYEKFLEKYPQQMQAYTNLSFVYFNLQRFDLSIATNHRALAASPGAFDPTVNIAITYKHIGVLDSALYYYQQARALKPSYPGIDNTILDLQNRTK